MPLIHITAPEHTFTPAARDSLAEALTVTALRTEELPLEPFDKSTTWIYFHEIPPARVYHGGTPGGTRVVTVEVNVFEGGLDDAKKLSLYHQFTEILRGHLGLQAQDRVPVYIVVREVAPINWGVFGGTTNISELRQPHPELAPI